VEVLLERTDRRFLHGLLPWFFWIPALFTSLINLPRCSIKTIRLEQKLLHTALELIRIEELRNGWTNNYSFITVFEVVPVILANKATPKRDLLFSSAESCFSVNETRALTWASVIFFNYFGIFFFFSFLIKTQ
jgi:hypothetical protein